MEGISDKRSYSIGFKDGYKQGVFDKDMEISNITQGVPETFLELARQKIVDPGAPGSVCSTNVIRYDDVIELLMRVHLLGVIQGEEKATLSTKGERRRLVEQIRIEEREYIRNIISKYEKMPLSPTTLSCIKASLPV